jgi:hypothetical protein
MWKLRDKRRDVEKEDPPLCKEEENVVHVLLNVMRNRGGKKNLDNNWLCINEKMAHKNNKL